MSAIGTTAPVPGVDIDLGDDALLAKAFTAGRRPKQRSERKAARAGIAIRQPRPPITAERLRELVVYDPKIGRMTRRVSRGGVPAGRTAGARNGEGYVYVSLDGRLYNRSRLAWLYMKGAWPEGEVDHANGIRDDDRIANLRDVSHAENSRNRRSRGRIAAKGVDYVGGITRPYRARIYSDGKQRNLGRYATELEAAAAYDAAAKKLQGRFAVSNRRAEPQDRVSFIDNKLGDKLVDLMFEAEAQLAAELSLAEAA